MGYPMVEMVDFEMDKLPALDEETRGMVNIAVQVQTREYSGPDGKLSRNLKYGFAAS
jgi:hypothetical protein